MRATHLLFGVALAAVLGSTSATAQEVVMRRPLPMSQQAAGTTDWHTTPWVSYNGGTQVDPATACGLYTDKRDVTCRKDDGTVVGDYFCTAPKPAAERTERHDQGCTYAWDVQAWVDGGPACTASKAQTRAVTCLRDADHAAVADSFCGGGKPDTTQNVADYSTCSHSWKTGAFVDPGNSCTAAERQERPVTCERDLDHATVDASKCDPATKPATSQDVRDDSGCTYSWDTGEYVDPGSSCTRSETQTRDVRCLSSLNSEVVADSKCAGQKPDATKTVEDYGSCQYTAVNWTDGGWNSTCSANATHTENAQCSRSNDGGEIVANSECTNRGVAVTRSNVAANYSSCTNSWDKSAYVDPGASCGTETLTRSVWCKRDLDALVLTDDKCDPGQRPAASMTQTDYSGCGYSAVNWTGWTYASQCSPSTSRTMTAQCRRSDGTIVADTECTSRGVSLSTTETGVQNFASCSFSWKPSGFVDPGASCGSETWTQTAVCERDVDHAVVADANCDAGTKPPLSDVRTDYSGCGYAGGTWTGYTYASQCSANTTMTRTRPCVRSDGTTVADSFCTDRGVAVSETVSGQQNFASCSFSWSGTGYQDPGASCTSNEIWTQTVTCKRDVDGAVVADGNCNAGTRPSATQGGHQDFSGCSYTPVDHGYGACDGTNKPHYWDCTRSDGTTGFPAAMCGHQNPEYENCYSYQNVPQPQSCSGGTQTVVNHCIRSDGAEVSVSNCGIPATTQQSCTSYAWNQGGWSGYGSCQPNGQQTRTRAVWCEANTGGSVQTVSDNFCDAGSRPAATDSAACTYYTYNWQAGGFQDPGNSCTANETWTQSVSCVRSPDNAVVADGNCNAGTRPASTQPHGADYSGCSYTPNYGAWSTCSNSQQSRTNTCTRNQTGESVDPQTYCGVPSTQTQSCAMPVIDAAWCQAKARATEAYVTHTYCVNYGATSSCPGTIVPGSTQAGYNAYANSPYWGYQGNYPYGSGLGECSVFRTDAGDICKFTVNPATGATSGHMCSNIQAGP